MSESVFSFTVPGTPVAQGSLRSFALPAQAGARARVVTRHTNERRLGPWRATLAAAARAQLGGANLSHGAVELDIQFQFSRPKGHYGTGRNAGEVKFSAPPDKTTRPDLDKLVRAVLDALQGQIFLDDAQVIRIIAEKLYGEPEQTTVGVALLGSR